MEWKERESSPPRRREKERAITRSKDHSLIRLPLSSSNSPLFLSLSNRLHVKGAILGYRRYVWHERKDERRQAFFPSEESSSWPPPPAAAAAAPGRRSRFRRASPPPGLRICRRSSASLAFLPPEHSRICRHLHRAEEKNPKTRPDGGDVGGRFFAPVGRARRERESCSSVSPALSLVDSFQFRSPTSILSQILSLSFSVSPTRSTQGEAHAVQPHVAHQDRGRRVQGRDGVLPRQGEKKERGVPSRSSLIEPPPPLPPPLSLSPTPPRNRKKKTHSLAPPIFFQTSSTPTTTTAPRLRLQGQDPQARHQVPRDLGPRHQGARRRRRRQGQVCQEPAAVGAGFRGQGDAVPFPRLMKRSEEEEEL